jgi:hypothetical protein
MRIAAVAFNHCCRNQPMPASWRADRFAELQSLRSADPKQLIASYCGLTGQSVSNRMPPNTSFMAMIDVIIDSEAFSRQSVAEDDKPFG